MPAPRETAACRLAHASQALSQDMALINGQPGLTGLSAATEVADHLSWVAEQLGLQAQLLAEYISNQNADGHVVAHPAAPPDTDVDTSVGLIQIGAAAASTSADLATRALGGIHGLMQRLATRDNLPERIGVDPAARAKGFAMNILHAAVLGNDELLQELAEHTAPAEAQALARALKATSRALARAHGAAVESAAEQSSE